VTATRVVTTHTLTVPVNIPEKVTIIIDDSPGPVAAVPGGFLEAPMALA